MALTDAHVRNAKPCGKPYKLTDSDGLYLQVQPTGSKLWRLAYRFLGKQRTLAIGSYPEISLQEARERRIEARRLLAQGIDPSEHKQQQLKAAKIAAASTFAAVAEEYLAKMRKQGLAKATIDKKTWILRDLVIPHLGNRPIAEISPSDVLSVLEDLDSSGRLETTKRARQLIGAVFRLATLTGRASGDPTHVLRGTTRAPKVTSHPAIIHEASFGQLLRAIERYKSPIIRLALMFQAHTFVRPGELRFATWDEIDIEDSVWRIPAERMKMRRPHDVPLVHATRTILRDVRRITGRTEGYLFPSPQSWRKPMSENALNKALEALGYKGKHTSHGFRSSASTILNERGYRSAVVEFQLAHIEPNAVRRAYNRAQYWDERVALMNDWADIIAELKNPSHSSGIVRGATSAEARGDGPRRVS